MTYTVENEQKRVFLGPTESYNEEKNIVRKALKQADFTDIKFSNGHYYFSGFATKNEKVIYFSISDVRHFPEDKVLIRTAKDYRDFTGGGNTYARLENDSIVDQANYLIS